MSKKMGRPKLPSGESKSTQIGVRFNASQGELIDKALDQSGKNKVDWIREAAVEAAKVEQLYVRSKWNIEDLNGKPVEFAFPANDGVLRGKGTFDVSEASLKGTVFIDILCTITPKSGEMTQFRFRLIQPLADLIKKHRDPSVSGYQILAVDAQENAR